MISSFFAEKALIFPMQVNTFDLYLYLLAMSDVVCTKGAYRTTKKKSPLYETHEKNSFTAANKQIFLSEIFG